MIHFEKLEQHVLPKRQAWLARGERQNHLLGWNLGGTPAVALCATTLGADLYGLGPCLNSLSSSPSTPSSPAVITLADAGVSDSPQCLSKDALGDYSLPQAVEHLLQNDRTCLKIRVSHTTG
jgi:hypothetical protein